MKNLKKGLMLFLVVLASGSTMAMGTVRVDVVPGQKDEVLVDILLAPNSRFNVELKNNDGKVVYTDREESPSFDYKKIYDFAGVNNGKYMLQVNLGDENEFNDLVVNNGKVTIVEQDEEVAPVFSLNGKLLNFSFINSEEKNARFLLFDNDTQNWVYQENIEPDSEFQQAINLTGLDTGSYRAMVISSNETYSYDFNLS